MRIVNKSVTLGTFPPQQLGRRTRVENKRRTKQRAHMRKF